MSENNTIERTQGTADYEPGSTSTITLARSHYYEQIALLVDYVVTPGTGASGVNNGILDLIEDIEVKIDADKSLKSYGLAAAHINTWYRDGTRPAFDSVDWSSETEQTGQVAANLDMLVAPGMLVSMLPSFQASALELKIKWANETDVTDVSPASLDASVTVSSTERLRQSVNDGKSVSGLGAFKENQRVYQIDAEGENVIDLPIGNRYHSIGVQVFEDGEPSESLAELVQVVENGVSTHKDSTFDVLRAKDFQQYNLEALADGFALLNYGVRDDLDDVINTRGMDQYQLVLDTNGQTPADDAEVRVVTRELV